MGDASRRRIREKPVEGHFGQLSNTRKGGGLQNHGDDLSGLSQAWRTSEVDAGMRWFKFKVLRTVCTRVVRVKTR